MNEDRARWMRRLVVLAQMPVLYSSDPEVQAFVEEEAALVGPFAWFTKSAPQLARAARKKFGASRCRDLIVRVH